MSGRWQKAPSVAKLNRLGDISGARNELISNDSVRPGPHFVLWGVRLTLLVALLVIGYLAFGPQVEMAPGGDKANHLLAFIVLAALLDFSFPRTVFTVGKMGVLFGYGLFIECVQYFLPERFFSVGDMFADLLGIGVYFVLRLMLQRYALITWLRKRLLGVHEELL
jgi:VanZ family protein